MAALKEIDYEFMVEKIARNLEGILFSFSSDRV